MKKKKKYYVVDYNTGVFIAETNKKTYDEFCDAYCIFEGEKKIATMGPMEWHLNKWLTVFVKIVHKKERRIDKCVSIKENRLF